MTQVTENKTFMTFKVQHNRQLVYVTITPDGVLQRARLGGDHLDVTAQLSYDDKYALEIKALKKLHKEEALSVFDYNQEVQLRTTYKEKCDAQRAEMARDQINAIALFEGKLQYGVAGMIGPYPGFWTFKPENSERAFVIESSDTLHRPRLLTVSELAKAITGVPVEELCTAVPVPLETFQARCKHPYKNTFGNCTHCGASLATEVL